ncbi:amidohydrolase family protein [Herbiconiux sp. 11R-BC]|uniref:amidohydrolase n=1 Tax=Herbiconiux sp. 11R-BC TaxID=3111637 RepID=UPI003C0CD1CD
MSAAWPPVATILRAPIVTMDPERPDAEAMAVAGDRIVAVGSLDDVRAAVPGAGEEALGGVILPGLIDAHLHMERGGLKALAYAADVTTVEEFMAVMLDTVHEPEWPGGEPTPAERVAGLEKVQPLLHALGFTGVVDPAVTIDELRGYREAHRQGLLTMRTVAMPYLELGSAAIADVDAAIAHLDGVGVATGFGDDTLRLGPIKVYFDGEGLRGEALLNEPWDDAGFTGVQRISDDDFARLVRFCADHGWGVGVHAVGGAAVDAVASVFAAEAERKPIADLRFQLIHAYLEPTASAIAAAASAGVIASLQPSLIWHNGRGLVERLGERAHAANPVRSWIDAGARVAFGSDGPFFTFDPRVLMEQAIGRRVSGVDQPLAPEQGITIEEALAAYTTGAAWASLAEHSRGMIRPGLYADWALWSADPREAAPGGLRALSVLRTDVGGRTVHAAPAPR